MASAPDEIISDHWKERFHGDISAKQPKTPIGAVMPLEITKHHDIVPATATRNGVLDH
jgi:hypothetical protein